MIEFTSSLSEAQTGTAVDDSRTGQRADTIRPGMQSIRRSQLGNFEYQVMVAVRDSGEEAYGLRIAERLLEKNSNLAVAQVYVTLRRLEDKGFVLSHLDAPRPTRGGRARKVFKLEGKGKQALEQSTAYHRALATSALRQGVASEETKEYADYSRAKPGFTAACG